MVSDFFSHRFVFAGADDPLAVVAEGYLAHAFRMILHGALRVDVDPMIPRVAVLLRAGTAARAVVSPRAPHLPTATASANMGSKERIPSPCSNASPPSPHTPA